LATVFSSVSGGWSDENGMSQVSSSTKIKEF